MKKSRYIKLLVLIICIWCVYTPISNAHPPSVACVSKGAGWSVDCKNHQAGKSFTYGSLISTLDNYSTATTDGVAQWSPQASISYVSLSSSPQGTTLKYTDPNSSDVAQFYEFTSNSSGHFTTWKIRFNTSQMDTMTHVQKRRVAIHEFGHAIGLFDLYGFNDSDKIMCGYLSGTATLPTTADRNGATEATRS